MSVMLAWSWAAIATAADPVVLLDPGATPRQELRLAPDVGDAARLRFEWAARERIGDKKGFFPAEQSTTVALEVDLEVVDVGPDTFTVATRVAFVEVGASGKAFRFTMGMAREAYAVYEGLEGRVTFDRRGVRVSGAAIPTKGGVPAVQKLSGALMRSLAVLFPPLPAEAVGVGARWSASAGWSYGGIGSVQSAELALHAHERGVARIGVHVEHALDPAAPPVAGTLGVSGTGTASVDLDLTSGLPQGGRFEDEWIVETDPKLAMGVQRLQHVTTIALSAAPPLVWDPPALIHAPGQGFALMATEVTQRQWRAVTGANPSVFAGCLDCPVEWITRAEALAFANAASAKDGLAACYEGDTLVEGCTGYRLPTEAEWERAALAGQVTRFSGGDDAAAVGWFDVSLREPLDPPLGRDAPTGLHPMIEMLGAEYEAREDRRRTHPVGTKQPNAWGFFDMSGNVAEWCWGPYEPGSSAYVARGSSMLFQSSDYVATVRVRREADERDPFVGLRLARTIPAPRP